MAGEKKGKDTALGVALAAAGIALISWARKAPTTANGTTLTLPPELMQTLDAMAADLSDINTVRLLDILGAIKNMVLNAQGVVPNVDTISSFRRDFLTANLGLQMDDLTVQDDMLLMVKADPLNPVGSVLRLGGSKAESENFNSSYPLIPNEFRALRVKNANNIWISASIVPAWVICSAERRF